MTPKDIDEEYKAAVTALQEAHGSWTSAMNDPEWVVISERSRAKYAMMLNPETEPERVMTMFSIDRRVKEEILGRAVEFAPKKRKDAYKVAILEWAAENVGAIVTASALAAQCDATSSSVRGFINERPDMFWAAKKKGSYEVRDPKADREADKEARKGRKTNDQ